METVLVLMWCQGMSKATWIVKNPESSKVKCKIANTYSNQPYSLHSSSKGNEDICRIKIAQILLTLLRRRVSLNKQHWKILILVHNFYHSVSRNLPKSSSKISQTDKFKPVADGTRNKSQISFSLFPKLSKCNNKRYQ